MCIMTRSQLTNIYNQIEAAINGSMTVMSSAAKTTIIIDTMNDAGFLSKDYPDVFNYLMDEMINKI